MLIMQNFRYLTKLRSIALITILITICLASGIALGMYSGLKPIDQTIQDSAEQDKPEGQVSQKIPNAYPFKVKQAPSSSYGLRIDPFTRQYKYHAGIDYSLPTGTPVLAAGDGKIKNVGYDQNNGQFIIIEHDHGYVSKYAHLKTTFVTKGNLVKQGQPIGEVGSTGRSTSPHLHFEISQNNAPINPLLVLNQEAKIIIGSKQIEQTSNITMQRVPFITNSGVTYRMVEVAQLR